MSYWTWVGILSSLPKKYTSHHLRMTLHQIPQIIWRLLCHRNSKLLYLSGLRINIFWHERGVLKPILMLLEAKGNKQISGSIKIFCPQAIAWGHCSLWSRKHWGLDLDTEMCEDVVGWQSSSTVEGRRRGGQLELCFSEHTSFCKQYSNYFLGISNKAIPMRQQHTKANIASNSQRSNTGLHGQ